MKLYVKGARLAWADSLFTAKANDPTPDNPSPKPKFQGTFIVEPTTLAFAGDANPEGATGLAKGYKYGDFKAALSQAILSAAQEKLGAQWQVLLTQLKAQNRLILHDGTEKALKEGYAGNSYFNASTTIAPVLRNKNGAQLKQSDGVLYPGCYVDGVFDVWAFQQRKSVNISILIVTFSHDGARLSGGLTASEEDYAAIPQQEVAKVADSGKGAAALF